MIYYFIVKKKVNNMGCCGSVQIPDIESRFPAIGIVSVDNNDNEVDIAVKPGPTAETFENLNFSDSSSIEAEMEHLSKLLKPDKKVTKKDKKDKKESESSE